MKKLSNKKYDYLQISHFRPIIQMVAIFYLIINLSLIVHQIGLLET